MITCGMNYDRHWDQIIWRRHWDIYPANPLRNRVAFAFQKCGNSWPLCPRHQIEHPEKERRLQWCSFLNGSTFDLGLSFPPPVRGHHIHRSHGNGFLSLFLLFLQLGPKSLSSTIIEPLRTNVKDPSSLTRSFPSWNFAFTSNVYYPFTQ